MNNNNFGLRPDRNEYADAYETYVSLVKGENVVSTFQESKIESQKIFADISEEKSFFRYSDGKWSIKELVGHLIDTERIFSFRALCFARNDKNAIAGMEQDEYIQNADFDSVDFADLVEEFAAVRTATILMFQHFNADAWLRTGIASDNQVSVRALAYMIAGHEIHHMQILKERYLI